jgi:hypothetical protein
LTKKYFLSFAFFAVKSISSFVLFASFVVKSLLCSDSFLVAAQRCALLVIAPCRVDLRGAFLFY